MMNLIIDWLKVDLEASWEKLADAVAEVPGYGEKTKREVLEWAGVLEGRQTLLESSNDNNNTSSPIPITGIV